nr:ADP-ribosylglycohydrolase family protein [Rhizobium sp. BK068]
MDARSEQPRDFIAKQGWVLIAFQNAIFHLFNSSSLERCLVDTISQGGDTDANAAIVGALMGAVKGADAIPGRWRQTLLSCRPEGGNPPVAHPRPAIYWPVDGIEGAERLLEF